MATEENESNEIKTRGIQYRTGEELGPHEIKHAYLKEAPRYRSPTTNKSSRRAVFLCGYCGNQFTSAIGSVKNGRTKSCGCVHNTNQAMAIAGNEFATKFKTAAEAKILLDQWVEHKENGYSVESFEHCDSPTFQRVVKEFPEIFTDVKLHYAEAKNKKFWETALIGGMMGKIKNFSPHACTFGLGSKYGWRPDGETREDDLPPDPIGTVFNILPAVSEVIVTNAKPK